MSLKSEMQDAFLASELERVILKSLQTVNPVVIEFCNECIIPIYMEAVAGALGFWGNEFYTIPEFIKQRSDLDVSKERAIKLNLIDE